MSIRSIARRLTKKPSTTTLAFAKTHDDEGSPKSVAKTKAKLTQILSTRKSTVEAYFPDPRVRLRPAKDSVPPEQAIHHERFVVAPRDSGKISESVVESSASSLDDESDKENKPPLHASNQLGYKVSPLDEEPSHRRQRKKVTTEATRDESLKFGPRVTGLRRMPAQRESQRVSNHRATAIQDEVDRNASAEKSVAIARPESRYAEIATLLELRSSLIKSIRNAERIQDGEVMVQVLKVQLEKVDDKLKPREIGQD